MAVSLADRYDTVSQAVKLINPPVAASTTIYKNVAVCANTAGNAVPASNTAGLVYLGQCARQANNSGGVAGAITVPVVPASEDPFVLFNFAYTGTVPAVGWTAYFTDDNTVTDTTAVATAAVKAGRIVQVNDITPGNNSTASLAFQVVVDTRG
jgi:hypothetical protein